MNAIERRLTTEIIVQAINERISNSSHSIIQILVNDDCERPHNLPITRLMDDHLITCHSLFNTRRNEYNLGEVWVVDKLYRLVTFWNPNSSDIVTGFRPNSSCVFHLRDCGADFSENDVPDSALIEIAHGLVLRTVR
jgi:hypothetical protein